MEEFVKTINHFEYCRFRDLCVERCNITTVAWNYWVKGGGVSAKYKPIINKAAMELFGKPVFNQEGVQA